MLLRLAHFDISKEWMLWSVVATLWRPLLYYRHHVPVFHCALAWMLPSRLVGHVLSGNSTQWVTVNDWDLLWDLHQAST